jgi:pyruvate dehydrogenase E2 component (dihydrolipoyllysine-residue acetyltransferase)
MNDAAPAAQSVRLGPAQRMAAKFLHESQTAMATVTLFGEIDVGALVAARTAIPADQPVRPTYTHFVIRAVALALEAHPQLNAHFDGETLTCLRSVDMGLAVARPNGELIVPVLRDAGSKSVQKIAVEAAVLGERARAGRLDVADVRGATFTLSSVGAASVTLWTTPIVPAPQVAILAVTAIRETAVVRDGALAPAQMLPVSLSFDHRAVNGAPASAFLETLAEILADPKALLADPDGPPTGDRP